MSRLGHDLEGGEHLGYFGFGFGFGFEAGQVCQQWLGEGAEHQRAEV